MEKDRKLILVTNDDGYTALGVRTLMKWLEPFGEVVGVCPDGPRSAQSMAITVNQAMRIDEVKDYDGPGRLYKVNGTPVDCVKLAMHTVLDRTPDIVVSGINHGSNAAVNVIYSGTMGAAFEGCAFGIPSVGFSLTDHDPAADFSPVRPFVPKIIEEVLKSGLPEGICLNVNVPHDKGNPTEMRVTRAARGKWTDEYEKYLDPFGRPFYWLKGHFVNEEPEAEDTDEWCLSHGIVSVTPELLDRSAPLDAVWIEGLRKSLR
ncbi:MAG: 5'/3'-nucleotidase SurE [Bacteroidales bacterium]|nr:5'/3'-nucleotidase SurE [Bacteroidales bacterium]